MKNRQYRTQGVDICGVKHDRTHHRTLEAAKKAQRRLERAYTRRGLQIGTEIRVLDGGMYYLVQDQD